jgi:hypothetical protein
VRSGVFLSVILSCAVYKVTRLDDFSPIGRLFTMGSFLRSQKQPYIWATFIHQKIQAIKFTKNGLGYISGDFFKNSSGHPGRICISVVGQQLLLASCPDPWNQLDDLLYGLQWTGLVNGRNQGEVGINLLCYISLPGATITRVG